ncbi:MAG TPA: BON domain-containing protein [Allocoleopsis sp.]
MGSSPTTLEVKPQKTPTTHQSPVIPASGTRLLFQSIPPERIGLHGEYDHSGLAKRVQLAFQQTFAPEHIQFLSVSQRGRVVVLRGRVARQLLKQLVEVAAKIHGATDVETYAVTPIDSSQ